MFGKVLALIKKEFLAIWRDPKSRMLIIMPPLLQLFIFANAITLEVKNIHMVILDRSNSVESRALISRFEHSKWFKKVILVENDDQLRRRIEIRRAQIGMEIDTQFATNIRARKPVTVQMIVDGRETNSAAIANGYAISIIEQFNKDITQYDKNKGASVNVVIRNWFNPNLEYQWFLLVSLITLLALVISLLLTALSIARERELGTFDQLIVSPLNSFEILLGKTIPPLCISIILTCFMTAMAMLVFRVPFSGSMLLYLFATVISLLSIVGVGLFISSLCKTQQQAILGVFTFQMPAVILSGFMSPIESMPVFMQHLTYINPIRFFMTVSKGIFLKGMGFMDVMENLIPLILIACFTLSLASWTFKRNLD